MYNTTEELTEEDYDEGELETEIMHAFYLIGIVFFNRCIKVHLSIIKRYK